jgi:cell division protein FtsQ
MKEGIVIPSEQVIAPRARSGRRRKSWRGEQAAPVRHRRFSIRSMVKHWRIAAMIVGAILLVGSYRVIMSSRLFALERIEVEGTANIPASRIEAMVRRAGGRGRGSPEPGPNDLRSSIFDLRLELVRDALKREPMIKEATVIRLLPDTVRVRVIERQPMAVVARSGKLVCVDEEGVILGDYALMGSGSPPLLGWEEGDTPVKVAANRERLQRYRELQHDLSAPAPNYWTQIDQVDLSDRKDVAISLVHRPTMWIHLGSREFRQRFELSQRAVEALERRNQEELGRLGINLSDEMLGQVLQIRYIDVSRPPRVVVRLPNASVGERKGVGDSVRKR